MTSLHLEALHRLELGGGSVETIAGQVTRLAVPPKASGYADAQLDDTAALAAQARFAGDPRCAFDCAPAPRKRFRKGTLGFGFWNDPFALSLGQGGAARRLPAPPQALWFFYASPPADLRFTPGAAGHGWKAMQLTTRRMPTAMLVALAPAAVLLLSTATAARPGAAAWRWARCRQPRPMLAATLPIGTRTKSTGGRRYGVPPRRSAHAARPRSRLSGPLGFVAWIDNQYATATPESGFRFGLIPTRQAQWLEIEAFELSAAGEA